jgi:hypothetical protein
MAVNTDLLGQGASLLRGAADTAVGMAGIEERRRAANLQNLQTGIAQMAETMRQKMSERAATERQNKQLDAQLIEITPELARGVAKATGDDGWNQAVGKKLRADVYSALLAHGTTKNLANKITTYEEEKDGKVFSVTALVDPDSGAKQEIARAPRKESAGGTSLMNGRVLKRMFPGTFDDLEDTDQVSTSLATAKVYSSGKFSDMTRVLSNYRDPITGGLKEGAQEAAAEDLAYLQNLAGTQGKVLVEVPPGVDDRFPDGGTAQVDRKLLPELAKKGIKPVATRPAKTKAKK